MALSRDEIEFLRSLIKNTHSWYERNRAEAILRKLEQESGAGPYGPRWDTYAHIDRSIMVPRPK